MEMYQDNVQVYILPENAMCIADEEKRSPLDIEECPIGNDFCTGDCPWYTEE